jgi:DNA-binding CsgD family transcriptional regulator
VPHESAWRQLADAALAVHAELTLDGALATLVEVAAALVGARHAAVGVLGRSGATLERVVGHTELLEDADHGIAERAFEVPIVIRGVRYARLAVDTGNGGLGSTSQDHEIITALAAHAAVAIENVRRYESAMRHLAQLKALDETTNDLAGEPDLPRLMVGVAERLRELLSSGSVLFFLPTADRVHLEIRAAAGEQREWLGSRLPRKESITGRVFDRATSERMDMAVDDPDVYQPLARPMNTRNALFVPLLSEGRSIGVIVATNKRGEDEKFSVDDLRLAETFAARCAPAVRRILEPAHDTAEARSGREAALAQAALTDREHEVLRLVAHGMSDAQVAERLVVSQRTVHSHLRSIYRKLGVESRSAATSWAVKNGVT